MKQPSPPEAAKPRRLNWPLSATELAGLRAGEAVLISGTAYTARDAAHKRLVAALEKGQELPFPIADSLIYYVGPTPAKPGQIIGSAGPTTSYRMDAYTPRLLAAGQRGMIGKGRRSPAVIEAIRQYGAVYFAAIGGAGAKLAQSIAAAEAICYEDLGTESVKRLQLRDFPAIVVIDSQGHDWYDLGPAAYLNRQKTLNAKE
ncbi:MAG: Fe-S-containing hydro-lyase [Oscillospiraceae bacterium]|nr:Fe-S-containing hydro-lyase [Oscillospiraceae bacterium]MDD4367841.1 Fe-S-containing hydro-lyase [Oscillospiraceae bacterium]